MNLQQCQLPHECRATIDAAGAMAATTRAELATLQAPTATDAPTQTPVPSATATPQPATATATATLTPAATLTPVVAVASVRAAATTEDTGAPISRGVDTAMLAGILFIVLALISVGAMVRSLTR